MSAARLNSPVSGKAYTSPVEIGPSVEVISDYGIFSGIKPAWDRLIEKSGVDHPFVCHEWISSWWESFGEGGAMSVLLVHSAGELVAAAPLMSGITRKYGIRVRRLGSLYNAHTPRFEFIVARGHEYAYHRIWAHLHEHCADWDIIELCQLPSESQTCGRIHALADADGCCVGLWQAPDSPYLSVHGGWDDYMNGLRAHHRSNLRNRTKRLESVGAYKLEVISAGSYTPADLEEGLSIEAAAWKGEAGTAIAVLPDVAKFYADLAGKMSRCGALYLEFLTVNKTRIAFGYSLCFGKKMYLLKSGYDPAYAPFSPVKLLCFMLIRHVFERGFKEFDFMGDCESWKLDWTSQLRPHSWMYVFSGSRRSLLLYFIKFRIAPFIRTIIRVFRRFTIR